MQLEFLYTLRTIWACMVRELRSMMTDRAFTMVGIMAPLNAFILMSLFVLAGDSAPIAVVMNDQGPYAQQFVQSMGNAHSFHIHQTSASQATDQLQTGHIVAVVTIPANFDRSIQKQQTVAVHVQINNLNSDFTNDIRRALPLSITSFYAKAFPTIVNVVPQEHDLYARDTDYIPYLTVSILIIGMFFGGIMHGGTSMANEWERATMKELLLSPAPRWAIVVGKMLGALVVNIISTAIVLTILIFAIGVHPIHWGEVFGFSLLSTIIFIAWGTLLGTVIKRRKEVVVLALGISFPLFFLSGPFGPISFNIPLIQIIAKSFPIYYSIVLQQHAFHNFDLNTYGVGINALILGAYALLLVLLAAFALQRRTLAH